MAKLLKLRRGTTSQHSSFTGAEGEVTVDTDKETLVVHDGSTAGGHPVAAQDMANVPAGTILGTQLENSGVSAGQYGSSSAIPIVTVDAQGLVTAASTTSIDSTRIDNGTSNVRVNNNGNIVTTRSGTDRFTVTNSGVAVVGNLTTTDNVTITSTAPKIFLVDSDTNDDFSINGDGGTFRIKSETDGANRFVVNSDGHVDIPGNLDIGAGIDVTGDITATGHIDLPDASTIKLGDSDEFQIQHTAGGASLISETGSGNLEIRATNINLKDSNGNNKLATYSLGVDITGNLNVSNGVDVTGNITTTSGNLTVDGIGSVEDTFKITDSAGTQYLLMGNQDSAGANCPRVFKVGNAQLEIGTGDSWSDNTGGTFTNQFSVAKNGQITSVGNHDFSAGIDVTGASTLEATTFTGNVTLTSVTPQLYFTDTNNNPDYAIWNHNGILRFLDITNSSATRLEIQNTGLVKANNSFEVTGNIAVSGTVDGRDVASDGSKLDGIESGATADQSASEILTLIKTVDGSGSGLDADTLDGIDQSSFLRSDSGDTANGDITFGGGAGAITIGGNSDIRFNTGSWTGNSTKIQHHSNYLYIQSDQSGIILRGPTSDRWIVDGSGHFVPSGNNTYNIGNTSNRVANIYVNDFHLSNKGHSNEMDGTWGDWTIQEGESDLFLKNNRSGKKYKFNLTEVS